MAPHVTGPHANRQIFPRNFLLELTESIGWAILGSTAPMRLRCTTPSQHSAHPSRSSRASSRVKARIKPQWCGRARRCAGHSR